MAGVDRLPDDILDNILARLPTKPLIRCRCVSKHWNHLIRDPNFIKSIRARRMIILVTSNKHLNLVDANVYPEVRVVGTINGIVVLQYYGGVRATLPHTCAGDLMLFNPFTRKYLKLPRSEGQYCIQPPFSFRGGFPHNITSAYGFGYGSSANDLKIVRFKEYNLDCHNNGCGGDVCEIFSLEEFMWSKPRDMNIKHIRFEETVGTFVNGFLYWIQSGNKLVALDVAKIVVSEIHLPSQTSYDESQSRLLLEAHSGPDESRRRLGTIHGRLCLLTRTNYDDADVKFWVMNENHSWCSVTLACTLVLQDVGWAYHQHHMICILDNGRILKRQQE
uniref:F-box protein CPR1-like n=1 Tax=Erigeron canadensis TaxID=72917 RepID=UPI001CB96945|nr:F-box protein CPR1-like [Erigeron canadensis]